MKNKAISFALLERVLAVTSILVVLDCFSSVLANAQTVSPAYNGKEIHRVSLDNARNYVSNYRIASDSSSPKGGYFGRSAFDQILEQKGCVGIRYYYAKTTNGVATLVLVGVDSAGADMVHGVISEEGFPCPPWCPSISPLNK